MEHPNLAPVAAGLRTIMRKYVLPGILFIALVSCSSPTAVSMSIPPSVTATTTPMDTPVLKPTSTPYVPEECAKDREGKVCILWFIGLGTGTSAEQMAVEQKVIADFNASQDKITVALEDGMRNFHGRDGLSILIARDIVSDIIVGPVGWGSMNDFHGQWLDLSEQIAVSGFDTGIFEPALVRYYQTEEGQISLPFAVFPGAIYYVPAMFDAAGLDYPPQTYGEKYELDGKLVDWNWETVTRVAWLLTLDKNGRNATQPGFDRTQIVQVGYTPQFQSGNAIATFYAGPSLVYSGSARGEYAAAIPDSWKTAWQWYYDGMWGAQPFILTGPLAGSVEFGAGNVFNSGKAAMGLTQNWYTCCLGDLVKGGTEFQLAIQPMGADGKVHGRVDGDSFVIWKGSKHPAEAFQVLSYLLTTGADKLLPVYGAMPAIASKTEAFFDKKKAEYPFVTQESWDVFVQGLAYPDIPSSESWMPNRIEGIARIATFITLMQNTPSDQFDYDAEYQKLLDDLTVIFNK